MFSSRAIPMCWLDVACSFAFFEFLPEKCDGQRLRTAAWREGEI
jgi:hypothetical protein